MIRTLGVVLALLVLMSGCRMLRPNPAEVMFGAHDANSDGQVTEAEWDSAMQQRFDSMDTNRDGVISSDEMKAAKKTLRSQFRSMR